MHTSSIIDTITTKHMKGVPVAFELHSDMVNLALCSRCGAPLFSERRDATHCRACAVNDSGND